MLRNSRTFAGIGAAMLMVIAGWAFAQRGNQARDPETLLPQQAILFAKIDGGLLHDEAYRQTAAYDALNQSGLMAVMDELLVKLSENVPDSQDFVDVARHVQAHGVSLAVTIEPPANGPPRPWGVIVVPKAGPHSEVLTRLVEQTTQGDFEFETEQRIGRAVTWGWIPQSPAEIGWWAEGEHLVIAVGIGAIDSAIEVAEGDQPNVTTSPLWEQYVETNDDFEQTAVSWLHFAPLVQMFGEMPIPMGPDAGEVKVQEALDVLGIGNLEVVVSRTGIKGRSIWSDSDLVTDGPRKGLLALASSESFTLADLPPLPQSANGIFAFTLNPSQAFETVKGVVQGALQFGPPNAPDEVKRNYEQLEEHLGFQLKPDLIDTLGNLHVLYSDEQQASFGLGTMGLVQVKNSTRLRRTLEKIARLVSEESRGEVAMQTIDKQGREIMVITPTKFPILTPAVCVDKDWLAIGLSPQAVEAFLLRRDGKLPQWVPDEGVKQAFAELPTEFTSLAIVDPRPTYQMLLGFAPMMANMAQIGARESGELPEDFEFPFDASKLPPTELVTSPLFVNVAVTTVDGEHVQGFSRQSLPGVPLLGGGGGGSATVATTGILVGLLLPAVQQARTAARRTQSSNNLRQIGLAAHNYHDVFDQFPSGTIPDSADQPEDALSWLVPILPFLDQPALYEQLNQSAGWKSAANEDLMRIHLPMLINPQLPAPDVDSPYGITDYVGMAGVGADGPELPVTSDRAGIFAYNRGTKFRDIIDGTSNTLMVGETSRDQAGPWGAGGTSTLRATTAEPCVNGPDGIGSGGFPGGANFLMGDGSVHFISENIDPDVFRALMTIRGGEAVGDF